MENLSFNFESVYDDRSLTTEFIESHLSHQMMYERYLNIPSADTRYKFKSPFNQDRTPSGSFFVRDGRLLWKDFSSGRGGDIYTLISELHGGIGFKEVLKTIASDFGLIKLIGTSTPSLIKKVSPKLLDTTPVDIKVYPKEWSPHELEYWSDYHITKKTLDIWDTKPCKEIWISDKLFYKYDVSDPCFRYTNCGGFKTYRPLADKRFKWRNNIPHTCVWGLKQLTFKTDTVFIVSSNKDSKAMFEMGFESVNLNSENCVIPIKLINWLKTKYKYVIIFLDADSTGLQSSRKAHKELDIPYLFLPLTLKIKDQADATKELGLRLTKEIILELLNTFIYEQN